MALESAWLVLMAEKFLLVEELKEEKNLQSHLSQDIKNNDCQ